MAAEHASSSLPTPALAHDRGHGHHHDHDHDHGHTHDHGHAKTNLAIATVGGIFLINSGLARLVYPESPFLSELSAVFGAVILSCPIIIAAIRDLIKQQIHIDVLVGIALLAAIVMREYMEAGIIAFFMLIAITIEQKTAIGAQASIEELVKLTPALARRLRKHGEKEEVEEEVPALDLAVGDVVRIRPGENFPADGKLVRGFSTVNQASITGESLPVDKDVDSDVYAGTQNLTGMVDVRVTRVGEDTTLGKVRNLIEQAEKTRLPILRMIDQYSVYYTPAILMIAALVWFMTNDLMRFVYVLVIGCPCALVIATPSAVVAAIASAARLGMLIKNVAHIEVAAKIRAVVFDKTGTLTEGKLEVARLNPVEGVELSDLLATAVSAESQSNHPTANAMRNLAKEANIAWTAPQQFTEVAGKGVIATFPDGIYRVGRESWFKECQLDVHELGRSFKENEENAGMSVIYVAKNEKVLGWIGLRDAIRAGAADAIRQLKELGVRHCCMFTGDHEIVARTVANRLDIHEFKADCLPETKVAYVEELGKQGTVAVVGDGVNDAPALAAGDIGIAMGAIGSDVAINSASIALMNNDLRRIPFLIALSRKTRTVINLNLMFGILLIIGGLMFFIFGDDVLNNLAAKLHFRPLKATLAATVHILGTLLVVFNSARLVRFGETLDQTPLTTTKG
jgi:Zn2+/Cd2+-exporting ATPase